MNKKALVVGLVMAIAFLNTLLAKYIHPSVQLPETVADDVAEYVLSDKNTNETDNTLYSVTHVVDGDTIDVNIDGEIRRVRYIGIDTPESVKPDVEVQCFGLESTAKNKELVEGKQVRLVRDISDVDKYDRLLRYVYVGDEFVNLSLIEEGYARSVTFPPDVAKIDVFLEAERNAKAENKGMWGDVCQD